jgi:hypothetical protein
MAIAEHDIAGYDVATRDELRGDLDQLSRELLGLNGEEFLEQWKAGRLDDFSPRVSRVALLARLIND